MNRQNNLLETYIEQHKILSRKVIELEQKHPNSLELSPLKKQKLLLKDRIEREKRKHG